MILLAGATGLVGGQAAQLLAAGTLHTVGRRRNEALPASVIQHVGPVEEWPGLIAPLKADTAICALGTTIRQAGSQTAFRAVDHDAALAFARAALAAGARHFLLVSSVGAVAGSSNFYLRTKGATEEAVSGLGFARVDMLRPGLLRGDRQGPFRLGEALAMMASPLTDLITPRSFDRYRSIAAAQVARAIAVLAGETAPGRFLHHNREMLQLAARML